MRTAACISFVTVALNLTLASGRRLSSTTSTTVFTGIEQQQLRAPLAVLHTNLANGGDRLASDLEIFAEDPFWASKVGEFMAAAGADADDTNSAISQVRHVSWGAGRTFRRKHVVLLSSAEDTYSDEGDGTPCRLKRAVLAVSRHTSNAHLTLVADGFALGMATREAVESTLQDGGWRGLTLIELPEFEGFSSAINRAVKTIPGNSVIAVLSTSVLLLDTDTTDTSASSVPKPGLDHLAGDEETASDIFVAYERLRSSAATSTSPVGCDSSHSSEAGPTSSVDSDAKVESASRETGSYDEYGNIRCDINSGSGNPSSGVLVTASSSCLAATRARENITTFEEHEKNVAAVQPLATGDMQDDGQRGLKDTDSMNPRTKQNDWVQAGAAPSSPPPPQPLPQQASILSSAAPLPLLVFDIETFLALGFLDEGFAFQGGVAEWISRSNSSSDWHGNVGGTTFSCSPASHRWRGSIRGSRATTDGGSSSGVSSATGGVRHVHEREWGRRFLSPWPPIHERDTGQPENDVIRAEKSNLHGKNDDATDRRYSTAKPSTPDMRHSSVGRVDGVPRNRVDEQASLRRDGIEGFDRSRSSSKVTDREVKLDEWSRLSVESLEKLVQADADLFFLPLLLLLGSPPADAANDEANLVTRCIAFHSDWMDRTPDQLLEREAAARREIFPVAVVVVVHDDISLMRTTLEEVAVAVEHILVLVSMVPWRGDVHDVSPTLEMLESMRGDIESPIHGKLQVEVGTWESEEEQRQYGNDLIMADPRHFARVLVLDTDEFWHPVELTKALVLAARNLQTLYIWAEMDTYWASLRAVVSPPEMLRVLWLVDPYRCRWSLARMCTCTMKADNAHPALDLERSVGVVHHLSYVRVDDALKRKMSTFSHAGEEQHGWYERSWVGWAADNSLTDLHPVVPEAFKSVVSQPLFRLTPALRALHLDAKKGTSASRTPDESVAATRAETASTVMGSLARGDFEAQVDGIQAFHEIATGSERGVSRVEHEGNQLGIGDEGVGPHGDDSDDGTDGGNGGGGSFRRVRLGCEEMLETEWTEQQRMMCLIPDAVGGI